MGPETRVLDGHESVDQVRRKLVEGGGLAVGTAGHQGIGQIALCIVDGGGKPVRLYVQDVHGGRIVDDSLDHAKPDAGPHHHTE